MQHNFKTKTAALWSSICGCFFADKRCVACHAPFTPHTHDYLCSECEPLIIKKHEYTCQLCGITLQNNSKICLNCINNPPPWDELNYYAYYDNLLKSLLLKYKFSADFSLIPLLAHCLQKAYKTLPPCDIIIPMPRHEKRLVAEGFNHILELCRPLAKQLQVPLNYNALTRTRYTPPQSSLNAKQRINNPEQSFMASQVNNKNILLVDDIITTGSTLHHASLSLRQAGAKHIYVVVIARVE